MHRHVFEGMKAYTTEDGHIVVFRPDLNAKRHDRFCNNDWRCRHSRKIDLYDAIRKSCKSKC